MSAAHPVSAGVDALIEKLRLDGVQAGREAAEKIVVDAQARARFILEQAQDEAIKLREGAKVEADRLAQSGREALQQAARDALLNFKNTLISRFTREVQRLVGEETEKRELLQRLILEVAAQVRPELEGAADIQVLLPKDAIGLEELSKRPEELAEGTLSHFVRLTARDLLKTGVTFSVDDNLQKGIKLILRDQGIEIELTDETIAAVLLAHLQPRFRALLEGIVR